MSGNLFSDVYKVKENYFGETLACKEISNLRNDVNYWIENKKVPDNLQYLLFKMTNRCNSDCKYCPQAISRSKNEIKNDIDKEIIFKVIEDAKKLGTSAIAVNGGEPLLRNDIFEIIEKIIDNKMLPVLMTNGTLLPKSRDQLGKIGLRYVIISFDSMIKEIYEKQRGISFEKALDGIEAAIKMREKYPGVEIHVSAVLTKNNQDDFINLVEYMTKRGIKVQISPIHNYLHIKEEISITDRQKIENLVTKLLEMKKDGYLIASSVGFIKHLVNFFCDNENIPKNYQCKVGYTNLFIDANMNVRPCWSDAIGPCGNLKNSSIIDIWTSEYMQGCREKMLKSQCEGCWYMCTGEVNMLLDNLLD